jgi:sugar lactone lactonase YvrE
MEKAGRHLVCLAVVCVLNICGTGWAVEVLEPGYVVETYAGYSDAGIERSPWDMVFVPDGNLYATQLNDRSLWRISPDGIAEEAATGLGRPTGLVWGGGTAYGDYLYVAVTDTGVVRVHLDGTVEGFASRNCAGTLGLDRAGDYGGFMYTTTGCVDHTYRVHPDGSVALFSNWPTHINGGGPTNVTFDNIGNYGGLFFVAAVYSASQPHVSGLFTLDPGGSATRFTEDIVQAHGVDFDPAEGFDGDMFVIGRSSFGEPDLLWRVSPDGTATEFATLSGLAPRGLTFGPDGAMYVGESKGVLPVAILGTEDFDVNDIDIASIRLEGVAPIRSSYEDVAAPLPEANDCNCTTDGPDGFLDLTLKFKTQEIVEALGDVNDGDVLSLTFTGSLSDETPIEGEDCVSIVGRFKPFSKGDLNFFLIPPQSLKIIETPRNLRLINSLSQHRATTHQSLALQRAQTRKFKNQTHSKTTHFFQFLLKKRALFRISYHFSRIFALPILTLAYLRAQKPT